MILQEFFFRILPSFELKLDIFNIMLVISLKSIGQRIKIWECLQYIRTDGRMDARHFHIPRSAFFWCGGQLHEQIKCMVQKMYHLKFVYVLFFIWKHAHNSLELYDSFFMQNMKFHEFKNPQNSTSFPKTMKIGTHEIKDILSI